MGPTMASSLPRVDSVLCMHKAIEFCVLCHCFENANNLIEICGDSSPEEADLVGILAAEVSSPNSSHSQLSHKLYGWESLQGFLAPGGSVVNLCQHTPPDASYCDRPGNAHVHFQNAKDVAACGLSTDHLTVAIDALTGQLYHWTDLNPIPQPVFSVSATPLVNNVKFEKIWAGEAHLLALASNGTLYSWGSGRHGQLGHGDLVSESVPKPIESLQGMRIIDAACGASFSVALSEAGDIYSFGLNDHGQLSIGEQQSSSGIKEGARTQKRNTAYPQLVDFYESNDEEEGRDVNIVKTRDMPGAAAGENMVNLGKKYHYLTFSAVAP
ncbi:RCC1 domain-containing protein 1 [Dissophora ornata]|nr:RCC1 domain-containing protein 1 [Dissophora ornata]